MKRNGFLYRITGALAALTLAATAVLASSCNQTQQGQSSGVEEEASVTIVLSEKSLLLDVGETFTLVANVTGSEETVLWTTENAEVATVNGGVVTGVADGTTRIYAAVGTDRTACVVTVQEGLKGLVSLTLDYTALALYQGYELSLTPTLKKGAETIAHEAYTVEWHSDDPTVVSVNGGTLTGENQGVATVTAKTTFEGSVYEAKLNVTVGELAYYTLTANDPVLTTSLTYAGEENKTDTASDFTVKKITPSGETLVEDLSKFTFTSSDEAIAKVVDGKLTAGSKGGVATISFVCDDTAGSFEVTVRTAISSEKDLSKLALAYARGVNKTDWGKDAYYVLMNDIDYQGALFIPIAADTGHNAALQVIGPQWKTVLTEGNAYGLSYADFVKKGLNGAPMGLSGTAEAGTSFQGVIDGQGYSISNANLMYDASAFLVGTTEEGKVFRTATQFIGMTGESAVMKNLAVENLGVQTFAEAGLTANTEYETYKVGATVGTDATFKVKTGGYYNSNSFGVFACSAGTMENLYIELNEKLTTFHLTNSGLVSSLFGRWIGTGTIRDCVFIDNYMDNETAAREYVISVEEKATVTFDNLLLITNNTDPNEKYAAGVANDIFVTSNSTLIGTEGVDYFVAALDKTSAGSSDVKAVAEEALRKALSGSTYSLSKFDGEYWDTVGILPLLK
ncbi:MAG: Ig-like domain-containing protein [Clostridia bacterium]|nr:Ig-like domain-containing protein [Clostridia bacterium]